MVEKPHVWIIEYQDSKQDNWFPVSGVTICSTYDEALSLAKKYDVMHQSRYILRIRKYERIDA